MQDAQTKSRTVPTNPRIIAPHVPVDVVSYDDKAKRAPAY